MSPWSLMMKPMPRALAQALWVLDEAPHVMGIRALVSEPGVVVLLMFKLLGPSLYGLHVARLRQGILAHTCTLRIH